MAVASRLSDRLAYPPRGMRIARAAAWVGMSERMFLDMVKEGVMPKPMRVKGMTIWDRLELDAAFDRLKPDDQEPGRPNPWDQIFK